MALINIARILVKLEIPDAEKRSSFFVPAGLVSPRLNLQRRSDYLLYTFFNFIFALSCILSSVLFLDALSGTNFLLDQQEFSNNKTLLYLAFNKTIAPVVMLLTLAFYVRLRLLPDFLNSEFPIFVQKEFFKRKDRRTWVLWFVFITCVGLFLIWFSYFLPQSLINYFELRNSTFFVLTFQILPTCTVSFGAMISVYSLLMLERIFRFYSVVRNEFEKI